ncbi:Ketoisovalerate oxidoreductase subunit VorB [uncultured delta proteobacterium]|uniref:Ketoisovalerate oxidoreductase subunit VorB n=1 Tax=uncultured delta proteobacterium TaxID=34034 RepID=A0A212KE33_9DELT|nr:Ketoisovalerate oxidoreductase subunit VorB [uncultured delta proteobacterium]
MSTTTSINAKTLPDHELFFGHKACAGCGGSIAVRLALKVLGPRTFAVVPANCMSAVGFLYPVMPYYVNAMGAPFAATAAILSGMEAAGQTMGLEDFTVVGFAGDGGTADIGIQALSGAIDRNDRIIYICYDNEAYMNTGVQESGLTPYGTRTTTSVHGAKRESTKPTKKNMFEIVAAHNIGYAATASVGHPQDYIKKIAKAKAHNGTSYIHVIAPCPTGWSTPTDKTVEIAKDMVDAGLWYLAEYENGEFKLNRNPKELGSVRDCLKKQGRFKGMNDDDIALVERQRDDMWKRIRANWVK